MATKKRHEMICGCYDSKDGIVFCTFHGNVQALASELNFVRGYFLQTTGEESPFVKRIDALLPRQK